MTKPDRSGFLKTTSHSHDHFIINSIRQKVFKGNLDNISRTKCYEHFFLMHPEIGWSFLAAMVSRNAGWNMADLYAPHYRHLLDEATRRQLLLTYERANWLIFRDAYPQLWIYHHSQKEGRPLFHLLKEFFVSDFMKREWEHFWRYRNKKRLLNALIVNEQHIIQHPVIEHPVYKRKVFRTPFYFLQELFHFSCVIFPTLHGELYGKTVVQFRKTWKRIELGKKLADILFHPDLFPRFLDFSLKVEHTGSRHDYERFMESPPNRKTPYLRSAIPVIEHHATKIDDWSAKTTLKKCWMHGVEDDGTAVLTDWFMRKQDQIAFLNHAVHFFS